MAPNLKIGVLLSGSGTNLQAIIDAAAAGLPVDIVTAVSSRPDAYGIERAQAAGIPMCTPIRRPPTRSSRARCMPPVPSTW